MKKTNKKGFTIVELVVVIAVVAILAAVLIPTFVSVVNKANVSNDTALVRNINVTIAAEEITDGKPATMQEALKAAENGGFDITKLTPRSGNDIVWDSENNRFALVNDKEVVFGEDSSKTVYNGNKEKLWKITSADKLSENYSNYISGKKAVETLTVKTGIDVGNANVGEIKYTGKGSAQTAIIRTNNGETKLEINAANDTVKHYGTVGEVNVLAVDKNNSYHEFGSARTLTVTSGHIVLESGSLVYELKKAENSEESNVSFANSGTVIKAEGITNVTTAKTYDIDNLDKLCAFRDYVNAGMDFSSLPVEIKADIDMSSVSWRAIGTAENPFNGEIRGNGHTLKGLTNGNVNLAEDAFTTSTTKTYGSVYGFIGIAGAKTGGKSLIVRDINFSAVNIDMEGGNCVGTLIGYAPSTKNFSEKFKNGDTVVGSTNNALKDIVITDVNVDASSSVTVRQDAGGICGKLYNEGKVEIKNCVNKGKITAQMAENSGRAAGIVSYISLSGKDSQIIIDGCKNEGTISAYQYLAGIACYGFVAKTDDKGVEIQGNVGRKTSVTVKNCSNSGELIWQGSDPNGKANCCRAGFIVTLGGTAFSNATAGCSYDFTTNNTNTGKLTAPNKVGTASLKEFVCWADFNSSNGYIESNGNNATK